MYELVQEWYFFQQKLLRVKLYYALRKQFETVENAPKLQNLSTTRWVYESEFIEDVLTDAVLSKKGQTKQQKTNLVRHLTRCSNNLYEGNFLLISNVYGAH